MMPRHVALRQRVGTPTRSTAGGAGAARVMQQDGKMSPVEAPATDTQALRDLDTPTPAEAAGDETGATAAPPPVVRNARFRPVREEPVPHNKLYVKVERIYDQIEAFVSRLSVRDNFWHSVCSLIWLPLAFFSGIRLKMVDSATRAFDTAAKGAGDAVDRAKFTAAAVLPFRRFNRNWYRAMAGGALLANSEIAGGMYVFGIVGGEYTVVCKHLEYKFLRPCFGPAVYRMNPRENVTELVAARGEFNVTVDMDILQQASRVGEKDKRVGQCVATFHVTPKIQHKNKRQRNRGR
jgi:hypothetical protein